MSDVSAGSKELLPIGSKAAIQWALEEGVATGADLVAVILSESKPDLIDHVASLDGVGAVMQP